MSGRWRIRRGRLRRGFERGGGGPVAIAIYFGSTPVSYVIYRVIYMVR